MSDTPRDQAEGEGENGFDIDIGLARRAVLKAAGASAALTLGSGAAAAAPGEGNGNGSENGNGNGNGGRGGGPGTGDGGSNPNYIDPVFGKPSAGSNPCFGSDGHEGEHVVQPDCLDEFRPPIRPSHQVELHIGIPGKLLGLIEDPSVSLAIGAINAAVEDGSYDGSLGGADAQAAMALANTTGFHFDPAGLHVEPGDVVLFSGESPDHAVASFHEAHGRQNRVPGAPGSGTGLISSPLVPLEGYWLYQFEEEGVYDLYCPPHAAFGMVMRVVVWDGNGNPPTVEDSVDPVPQGAPLRPPSESNALPGVLGGLDPEIPSSHWTLEESDQLDPSTITTASEGAVHWEDVVAEYRTEN